MPSKMGRGQSGSSKGSTKSGQSRKNGGRTRQTGRNGSGRTSRSRSR